MYKKVKDEETSKECLTKTSSENPLLLHSDKNLYSIWGSVYSVEVIYRWIWL